MTIAESLKRFRREYGLSQKAVADKLGIKQPSYAAYELSPDKQKASTPSGNTIIKLAREFNVSTDYLLGLSDNPRRADESKNPAVSEVPADSLESRVSALKKEVDSRFSALEEKLAQMKSGRA